MAEVAVEMVAAEMEVTAEEVASSIPLAAAEEGMTGATSSSCR